MGVSDARRGTGDRHHGGAVDVNFAWNRSEARHHVQPGDDDAGQVCCCEFDADGELREPCVYHAQVIGGLKRERDAARAEAEECKQRCCRAAQKLIEEVGAPGPEGIEETAGRVASKLRNNALSYELAQYRDMFAECLRSDQEIPKKWTPAMLRADVCECDGPLKVRVLGSIDWHVPTLLVREFLAALVDPPVPGDSFVDGPPAID